MKLPPPPKSELAVEEKEQGFQILFDGSETEAEVFEKWRMVGEGRFTLSDQILVAEPGEQLGLLYYTKKQFDNFVLRLDFLLPKPYGEGNDNSGVHLRFRNPIKPLLPGTPRTESPDNPANVAVDTGYEVQIDEEARGDKRRDESDGHFYNRTGAIYKIKENGLQPGQQNFTNDQALAACVWHSYEITAIDRTYSVLLNGKHATTFIAGGTDPREIYRGRKCSDDPDSGFIGLQTHTGRVAFANVRVKVL